MGISGLAQAMRGGRWTRRPAAAPPAQPMRRLTLWALVLVSVVGELLSLYLTYVHFRVHRDPWWESACNLTPRVNCDLVLLSPLATFAGVPLSLWGALFYLFLLGVLSIGFHESSRRLPRSPAVIVFAATSLAVGVSVALALLSVTALRSLCLLCATLYLVNALLMLLSWHGVHESGDSTIEALRNEWLQWRLHGFRGFLLISGGALAVLGGRFLFARYSVGGSDICGSVSTALREAPSGTIGLEVYSDLQCPHCRALDRDLRRLAATNRVRVVQEHFPLETSCNPGAKRTVHAGACTQARAAICAEALGQGAAFRQLVFDESAQARESLTRLAAAAGLDAMMFDACLMADETFARLRTSIERGRALGVEATPTVLVNGRKHVGGLTATDLDCLLAAGKPR